MPGRQRNIGLRALPRREKDAREVLRRMARSGEAKGVHAVQWANKRIRPGIGGGMCDRDRVGRGACHDGTRIQETSSEDGGGIKRAARDWAQRALLCVRPPIGRGHA